MTSRTVSSSGATSRAIADTGVPELEAMIAPECVAGVVLASPAGRMYNQPLARALLHLAHDVRRESWRMARVMLPDYVQFGPVNALQLFGELVWFPSLERILRTPVPTLL